MSLKDRWKYFVEHFIRFFTIPEYIKRIKQQEEEDEKRREESGRRELWRRTPKCAIEAYLESFAGNSVGRRVGYE